MINVNYIEPSMRQMLDMFIFETSLLLEQLDEIMIQIEKEKYLLITTLMKLLE